MQGRLIFVDEIVEFTEYGLIWYQKEAVASIIYLNKAHWRFGVRYESNQRDCILEHKCFRKWRRTSENRIVDAAVHTTFKIECQRPFFDEHGLWSPVMNVQTTMQLKFKFQFYFVLSMESRTFRYRRAQSIYFLYFEFWKSVGPVPKHVFYHIYLKRLCDK